MSGDSNLVKILRMPKYMHLMERHSAVSLLKQIKNNLMMGLLSICGGLNNVVSFTKNKNPATLSTRLKCVI